MPEISLADLHETLSTWQNSLKGHQVQKSNTVICTWTSLAFQHWEVPQASQLPVKAAWLHSDKKEPSFFYAVSEILWDVVGIAPVVCFPLPPFQMLCLMSLWLWELRTSPMLFVPLKRVQEGTNSLTMNCLRRFPPGSHMNMHMYVSIHNTQKIQFQDNKSVLFLNNH